MTSLPITSMTVTPVTAEPVAWAITLNGVLRATLSTDEVATLMGVDVSRVRVLIREGRIKTLEIRPGSARPTYLIPVGPFLQFLNTFNGPTPPQ